MTEATPDVGAVVGERSGRLGGGRRRRIVSFAESRVRPVTVSELTGAVVDWERERGLDSDWAEIHLHLYEVDLPMLDDAGLLRFDQAEGVVTAPPRAAGDWGTETRDRHEASPAAVLLTAATGVVVTAAVAAGRAAGPDVSPWLVGAAATLVVVATLQLGARPRGRLWLP
jgi:hypothetical protein